MDIQNTLIALVMFIVVIAAMKIIHKDSYKENKVKLMLFAALYIFFLYALNKYGIEDISYIRWITLTSILYIVLDDILHREFNLLAALFVIMTNFFLAQDKWLLYISVGVGLAMLILWLGRKFISKKQSGVLGGLSAGDPWLILMFIGFFNVDEIFELFIISWVIIVIGFVIQKFRKKTDEGLPLAPLLMLAAVITYLYPIANY